MWPRRILVAVGFFLAVVALSLGAAASVLFMVDFVRSVAGIIQWGNVASWASAIASAAVFVAGVLVFKRDNRLRREDEEKLRKAERRQQAERITAWKTPDAGMQVDGAYQKLIVGLINDSTGVAYDVRIYVVCHRTEEVKRGDRLYKPEENEAGGHIPALPPGKWNVEIKLSTVSTGRVKTLDVYFRDQATVLWRRNAMDGALSDPPPPAPPFSVPVGEPLWLWPFPLSADE